MVAVNPDPNFACGACLQRPSERLKLDIPFYAISSKQTLADDLQSLWTVIKIQIPPPYCPPKERDLLASYAAFEPTARRH